MISYRKSFVSIINLTFIIVFIIQLSLVIYEYVHPHEVATTQFHQKLANLSEFPIILKLCIKEGFNETKLKSYGYKSEFHYYMGQSIKNKTTYGWNGHDNVSSSSEGCR